jgi:hypothetical protein
MMTKLKWSKMFVNLLVMFLFGQTTPLGVMDPLGRMVVQYFLSYDH